MRGNGVVSVGDFDDCGIFRSHGVRVVGLLHEPPHPLPFLALGMQGDDEAE